MSFSSASHGRLRRVSIAAAIAAALVVAGRSTTPPATAQQAGGDSVHVANTGGNSERLKTIPISRKARGKQRVVMSLGPKKLKPLRSGDRVEGLGEVEVSTTCLERMRKCVGRIYRFSPTVEVRLVLARTAKATRGAKVMPVSGWNRIRCSQQQPHRNHHCVLVVRKDRAIPDASKLPCPSGRCYLNMVISANHPSARRGHQLVIGVDDPGKISQNKGQLSAAVYRPGKTKSRVSPLSATTPRIKTLRLGGDRPGGARKRVVASLKLNNLRAGERLVVDARMLGKIKHLGYASLVQSQLILSSSPGSTKREGPPKRIGSFGAQFGVLNGFNCTTGRSAHSHPCEVRKYGVMRIIRDARARPWKDEGRRIPLYVNLVVGARAVGVRGYRYRSGDRMRIKAKGSFIRVHRYGPEYRR